jgi:Zn-dependent protease
LLFALGQPVAFAGLLLAFLVALALRAVAIRLTARSLGLTDRREPLTPRPREDVDPFGAVAAAVAGAGWGKTIDVDEVPRFRGRGRAAAVCAAGPITVLLVAQAAFAAFRLAFPRAYGAEFLSLSDVVRGQFDAPSAGAQFLLAFAGGLLVFGLLALIPMPPLDGFGLLWFAQRNPGPGMQGYRLWFEHKNIGVVVLIVCSFFPLGSPLLFIPLNLLGTLFLRLWAP